MKEFEEDQITRSDTEVTLERWKQEHYHKRLSDDGLMYRSAFDLQPSQDQLQSSLSQTRSAVNFYQSITTSRNIERGSSSEGNVHVERQHSEEFKRTETRKEEPAFVFPYKKELPKLPYDRDIEHRTEEIERRRRLARDLAGSKRETLSSSDSEHIYVEAKSLVRFLHFQN